MSLSSFFRDYVYIPLGGNRVSIPRHILNMLCVWALTGIWHGANWNYILWGLYWFVFLVLEKYLIKPKKDPKLLPRMLGIAITLVVTFFSTMLFKFNDLAALGQAIANIFVSNGGGFSDTATNLLFKNNIFFLAAAILACTPIIPAISKLCKKTQVSEKIYIAVSTVTPVILIVVSAFALAGDSYNPFLYFQF
jgi:alginate O-acetyltransferase complex protein AlgI